MSLLNASKFRTKINCDTSMTQGEVRVENTEIILTLFCAETYFCKNKSARSSAKRFHELIGCMVR